MVEKTNLLVVATLIFLTMGPVGCGQDTDIEGNKIPDDHPFRSGKIVGTVLESVFAQNSSAGLLVRDDNQLNTIVFLNYKPDMENILGTYKNNIPYNQHLANGHKKYNDSQMAFKNKYVGTRVECVAKDFLLPSSAFGSCKQKGESVGDWLKSGSMGVPIDSVKAYFNPDAWRSDTEWDPFFKPKRGGNIPEDHPWRSKKIAGTVVNFVVTPERSVAARIKNDITGDITEVLIYHNVELNVRARDFYPIKEKMEEAFNNKYKGKKAKCNITALHSGFVHQENLGTVEGVCKPDMKKWVGKEIDRIDNLKN